MNYLVLGTVFVLVWLGNIAFTNGRLFEYGVFNIGVALAMLTLVGFQMNKSQPISHGSDGYEQSRIAFAWALAKKYPEFEVGAKYDAYVISQWMGERGILLNEPYIKEMRDYYLQKMSDNEWEYFAGQAYKIYVN